jgi:hypothetical protein
MSPLYLAYNFNLFSVIIFIYFATLNIMFWFLRIGYSANLQLEPKNQATVNNGGVANTFVCGDNNIAGASTSKRNLKKVPLNQR